MGDMGSCADEVCLLDVNLVVRNKLLYLYDFGDEWMFYITVMKIRKTDQVTPTKLIHSQGELEQYPDGKATGKMKTVMRAKKAMREKTTTITISRRTW